VLVTGWVLSGETGAGDLPGAAGEAVRAKAARAHAMRAETVRADTVRADTVRADTVRADTVGADPAAASRADVAAYRDAVARVLAEFTDSDGLISQETAEWILSRRLPDPVFTRILDATPSGAEAAIRRILREVRDYRHSERSSAGNLSAMIRIALLAQIDAVWWGQLPAFENDADVRSCPELHDLDLLRRDGLLRFKYRHQTSTLAGRALRTAERLAAPGRAPRTAGLRFACARAELVVMLNQIAADFARHAPAGTPPLWVTSLARSVAHQRHLRHLGYAALLPSAHCVGSAADVEMTWFRRFGADQVLQSILLDRQAAEEINVIDEGQAWHVCVRPGAVGDLLHLPGLPKGR
jgi:hypothetical protein